MADNAFLTALCKSPAMRHIDVHEVVDQLYVDFTGASHVKDITGTATADSNYNLVSGGWFTAFKLPQGALVTMVGWVTHTTDANNPTFAITTQGGTGDAFTLKSATAIGAQYVSVIVPQTATEIIPNDATTTLIRVTGGTATNDAGIVTFFVKYIVNKRQEA